MASSVAETLGGRLAGVEAGSAGSADEMRSTVDLIAVDVQVLDRQVSHMVSIVDDLPT